MANPLPRRRAADTADGVSELLHRSPSWVLRCMTDGVPTQPSGPERLTWMVTVQLLRGGWERWAFMSLQLQLAGAVGKAS
ncbi:hypothetical protein GCM10027449_24050 [Sinomonas notoginsengisoli]